jgi:hypothetical protein
LSQSALPTATLAQRRVQLLVAAFETPIRLGQTVLQNAFEACFGVTLLAAAALLLLEAALAAAHAVIEQQPRQGQGGGDNRAAAE